MTKLITQGKINDTISRMVRSAREARKIEANGDEQYVIYQLFPGKKRSIALWESKFDSRDNAEDWLQEHKLDYPSLWLELEEER